MKQTTFTEAERTHLNALLWSRPDWRIGALAERMVDEDTGSREHKYPRSHPYITGMQYVMKKVIPLAPCSVLDIGSPLTQNVALACVPGVDVTVVDVRPHEDSEMLGLKWEKATATALPFADSSWSIVTSMWVMGHVGDGRYGDALDANGDLKMLCELTRVLRPGGTLIFGPGLIDERCGNIFNLHRIYSWPWLLEKFDAAGLDVVETKDLFVEKEVYIEAAQDASITVVRRDGNYGVALLRKR